jgi:hypothetical protein
MVVRSRKKKSGRNRRRKSKNRRANSSVGVGNLRGAGVSTKARRALNALSEEIKRNTAHIEETLRKAGVNPDPALVYSAAKYFEALNKLAAE